VPDYARRLRLPVYTRLIGGQRRERYLEPAYFDLLAQRLPELENADGGRRRRRLVVEARFHWELFRLTLACLALPAPPRSTTDQVRVARPRRGRASLIPTIQEVHMAARALRRRPLLTSVIVATLGLAMGSATAVLGGVRAVLMRPLPYPHPERLVYLWATWPGGSGNFSFPDYRAMVEETRAFEDIAAYEAWGNVALTDGAVPVALEPNFITPSYLKLLGARPAAGRLFDSEDDRSGAAPVVLLGEAFWRRQMGSDGGVVGRSVTLNGLAFTVVGIVAQGFADLARIEGPMPDVWLPATTAPALLGQPPLTDVYRIYFGIARLRPGVTVAEARAELAGVARRLAVARPSTHRGYELRAEPLGDRLRGPFAQPVLLLAGGALLLLLMGCANTANLLLARLADRRREMAVRRALGASEAMLLRQLLTEALLLAALGGAVGALLAIAATSALRLWLQENVSSFVDVVVDGPVLAVCALLSLATALMFGLAPAVAARTGSLHAGAMAGARGSEGRGQARRLLVAAQVGLSVVLLVGAGLMTRSLHALTTVDLGFRPAKLITARLDLGARRYAVPDSRVRFAEGLIDRAGSSPDIESTTLWGPSLLGNATWVVNLLPAERPADAPGAFTMAFRHSVNPGALRDLGIPLVAGREIEAADTASTPLVAVVSASLAREFWPGGDAVGRQMRRQDASLPPITVVGVAADARHRQRYSLGDIAEGFGPGGLGPQRDVYLPYAQRPNTSLTLAVRARTTPARAADEMRRIVASLDPDLPLIGVRTLEERLAEQDTAPAALAGLLATYGALALLLTALGLYGVLAHSVAQRTREIGIRMALGAARRSILGLVLREGLGMTLAGAAAGVVGALGAARLVRSLLFGIAPYDPWTVAGVVILLAAVSTAAMLAPLRRATRVDPIVALRCD
jgi:putative ABC transport system permease protein